MIASLSGMLLAFAFAAVLFVGIVGGLVMGAWLAREDLRAAHRDIVMLRDLATSAGVWPPASPDVEPATSAPTHAEGR
jgi:hypothetical protein